MVLQIFLKHETIVEKFVGKLIPNRSQLELWGDSKKYSA